VKNVDFGTTKVSMQTSHEPMPIGILVHVRIDNDNLPNTCVGKLLDDMTAATAGADYSNFRASQLGLSLCAYE
jgi:hypothetical protein